MCAAAILCTAPFHPTTFTAWICGPSLAENFLLPCRSKKKKRASANAHTNSRRQQMVDPQEIVNLEQMEQALAARREILGGSRIAPTAEKRETGRG